MEYPLGANIASGACKPTHRLAVRSGIQNPVLRHPRFNAGSQKRPDTAHAEVFSCAGLTSPRLPRSLFSAIFPPPPAARAISDFSASLHPRVTSETPKTPIVADRPGDVGLTLW